MSSLNIEKYIYGLYYIWIITIVGISMCLAISAKDGFFSLVVP